MRITKVKLLNEGAAIDWQTQQGDATVKHAMRNGEEASPGFQAAVGALEPDVQSLMQVPDEWMESVTVKGLSVSYDDDGVMELALSFTKRFDSGRSMGYSTVRVRERADDTQTGSSFMGDGLAGRVHKVLDEAEAYVNGLRAQREHVA